MLHAAKAPARTAALLTILATATPSLAQAPSSANEAALPSVELPQPLARVLTDYESAWGRKDAKALAALFTEDGFVLSGAQPFEAFQAIIDEELKKPAKAAAK